MGATVWCKANGSGTETGHIGTVFWCTENMWRSHWPLYMVLPYQLT